jgi:hypothetical protein
MKEPRFVFQQTEMPRIIMETDSITLHDLLEDFEAFLRGAGYVFEGQLDIVPEENPLRKIEIETTDD